MKIHEILGENFAGAIASVPMALGSGDPKASIYAKKSKKKDKKTDETKHTMIKRQQAYEIDTTNRRSM